jgi:hypothetical protein
MRRGHAKLVRARTEENNRRPTKERAGSARARSARSAVPKNRDKAKLFRGAKKEETPRLRLRGVDP